MAIPPPDVPYVLDHVAFAVAKAAAVPPLLVGRLGGRPLEAGNGNGFRWWQWEYARKGVLEVLEPNGEPDSFVERFLASRGPGIHHVTFKVKDLAAAAARMRSLGYEVVGYFDEFPSWKECFLHPKEAQGIVVQLAEAHPELEPEGWNTLPFPDGEPPASPPADVVGLRLAAASADRARHQWEAALGGRCSTDGERLYFHWPDSALRLAVEIDATAPEGPLAVEIAAPEAHGWTPDAEPVLGARFTAVPESAETD